MTLELMGNILKSLNEQISEKGLQNESFIRNGELIII